MSNKKYIILAIVVLILAVGGVFLYRNNYQLNTKIGNEIFPAEQKQGEANGASLTRTEVPENVKVPEVGEEVGKDIAAPISVTNVAPGVSAKLRTFNISAENNTYNPSTVIAKIGDTVHINFTAVDKTYDITFPDYGMKQTAEKGQTKILEFQALNEGKFTYYCSLCGDFNSTAIGYIIVAP